MLYSKTIGVGADLVMLHGWGFNADVFNNIVHRYKHIYRITLIDLPGHGRSAEVIGGLDEWSSAIIKKIPDNAILFGWSLGGLLAINIASIVKIKKLILVASSPNFVQSDSWRCGIPADNFTQFADNLTLNLSKGLKRFVSLQSKNKSQIKDVITAIETYPANKIALKQGLQILLHTDLREKLIKLNIKVQVTLGKNDILVPCKINHWYKEHNITTNILDTAHLPFLESDFSL